MSNRINTDRRYVDLCGLEAEKSGTGPRGLMRSFFLKLVKIPGAGRRAERSLACRAMAAQERSAALPSGEGAAALLGGLAGYLGGTSRKYCRWHCFARVPCKPP